MITVGGGLACPVFSAPADTNLTTVYTQSLGQEGSLALLQSINIAAIAGADATVIINDGSTDYTILSAKTLAADAREYIEWQDGFPLKVGHSIKVKTSVNDALVFSIVVSEMMQMSELPHGISF